MSRSDIFADVEVWGVEVAWRKSCEAGKNGGLLFKKYMNYHTMASSETMHLMV